jgi:hypothetical protein
VNIKITVLWDVTPCCFENGYQHFGRTYRLHLRGWRGWHYVPPKRRQSTTRLHALTSQKDSVLLIPISYNVCSISALHGFRLWNVFLYYFYSKFSGAEKLFDTKRFLPSAGSVIDKLCNAYLREYRKVKVAGVLMQWLRFASYENTEFQRTSVV